jgi:uncharacterized protein (DUF111 family)
MQPDLQIIFNILVALVGALGGWILNGLRSEQVNLRSDHNALADKLHEIDKLVAGTYVKRDDMEKLSTAIFTKLDRIEGKLDGKQDR